MPDRNVVSWTSLMMDYSNNGDPEEAIEIYCKMKGAGVGCGANSFATVIILAHVMVSGSGSNVSVANTLINMFGSCGDIKNADCVFNQMAERDTISWNSIISAYSKMGFSNLKPSSTALSCLVSSCSNAGNLRWGMGVHGLIIKLRLVSIICVANTLSNNLYSESGGDLISLHSMTASSVHNGHHRNALELLAELFRPSKIRNHVTFASALAACSVPEALLEGKTIHVYIIRTGLPENLLIGNTLVTMCGKYEVTWNALIGGSVENEEPQAAIKAYKSMRKDGISVNYKIIASILGSCSAPNDLRKVGMSIIAHIVLMGFGQDDYLGFGSDLHVANAAMDMYGKCGDTVDVLKILPEPTNRSRLLWNILISGVIDEGLSYFCSMMSEFGVTQGIQHCICIIDLLEVEMPVPPNDLIWQSLLSACRNHNNLELGKKATQHLQELDPSNDAAYVLLSNVCAVSGRSSRSFPLHSLINSIDGSVIRIFKNLCVCGDCHSMFKFVSQAVQRTIVLRDSYRFRHFSGGDWKSQQWHSKGTCFFLICIMAALMRKVMSSGFTCLFLTSSTLFPQITIGIRSSTLQ
ncbi:hypothetical protein MKW92_024965 [Papaver armeniacum]|nr:hypothetical protein MKW92_024965 [Papaver armeniacum]